MPGRFRTDYSWVKEQEEWFSSTTAKKLELLDDLTSNHIQWFDSFTTISQLLEWGKNNNYFIENKVLPKENVSIVETSDSPKQTETLPVFEVLPNTSLIKEDNPTVPNFIIEKISSKRIEDYEMMRDDPIENLASNEVSAIVEEREIQLAPEYDNILNYDPKENEYIRNTPELVKCVDTQSQHSLTTPKQIDNNDDDEILLFVSNRKSREHITASPIRNATNQHIAVNTTQSISTSPNHIRSINRYIPPSPSKTVSTTSPTKSTYSIPPLNTSPIKSTSKKIPTNEFITTATQNSNRIKSDKINGIINKKGPPVKVTKPTTIKNAIRNNSSRNPIVTNQVKTMKNYLQTASTKDLRKTLAKESTGLIKKPLDQPKVNSMTTKETNVITKKPLDQHKPKHIIRKELTTLIKPPLDRHKPKHIIPKKSSTLIKKPSDQDKPRHIIRRELTNLIKKPLDQGKTKQNIPTEPIRHLDQHKLKHTILKEPTTLTNRPLDQDRIKHTIQREPTTLIKKSLDQDNIKQVKSTDRKLGDKINSQKSEYSHSKRSLEFTPTLSNHLNTTIKSTERGLSGHISEKNLRKITLESTLTLSNHSNTISKLTDRKLSASIDNHISEYSHGKSQLESTAKAADAIEVSEFMPQKPFRKKLRLANTKKETQEIQATDHHELQETNNQEIKVKNHQEIQVKEHQDIKVTDHQEIQEEEGIHKSRLKVPSWATEPELFEHLRNQESMDPDSIFGRCQSVKMNEIFKGYSTKYKKSK